MINTFYFNWNNIIIIIIIIIIIVILFNFKISENFDNNIIILDKYELLDVLLNDYDNYYSTFNELDLKVRNVKSIEEYKYKIKSSPVTISEYENNIIINTIHKIKNIFNNYNYVGFNGKKANNIKFIIGIIDGKNYEEGFPHTRKMKSGSDEIIIIPKYLINKYNLITVLIHEMVHIYQKIHPEDIQIFLDTYNFKKNKIRLGTRANPDIDNFIYTNSDNELMYCIYNNDPESIMDVIYYPINNEKYEHPYELIAYSIEFDIINKYKLI